LAQVICIFMQGHIADRGQDAQQFCASGLNLVIAAIVYWDSTYLADAIEHMRADGKAVTAELCSPRNTCPAVSLGSTLPKVGSGIRTPSAPPDFLKEISYLKAVRAIFNRYTPFTR
jgi:hypothetical protein